MELKWWQMSMIDESMTADSGPPTVSILWITFFFFLSSTNH